MGEARAVTAPGSGIDIEVRRFFEIEDFPPSEGLNKQIELSKEMQKQKEVTGPKKFRRRVDFRIADSM